MLAALKFKIKKYEDGDEDEVRDEDGDEDDLQLFNDDLQLFNIILTTYLTTDNFCNILTTYL